MHRFHTNPLRIDLGDLVAKRLEIRDDFLRSYALFESLFDLLKDDTVFYRQSERTRQPMIFYFGHTAVFFINKLLLAKIIDRRIDPELESIFAIGVDEMAWDDVGSVRHHWPEVAKVRRYRAQVKSKVLELIDTLPLSLPITFDSPWWVILMGIEHERIHIETSSVLHRQMPLEYIKASDEWRFCPSAGEAPSNAMVQIAGAQLHLGKQPSDLYYGWDNEYGDTSCHVDTFKAAKMLTSNGEYLLFVEAGGYEEPRWWDEEGRAFLERTDAKHPPFWMDDDRGGYRLRLLDREIEMPLNWPVEVNTLEAEAFCRYKSEREGITYRLPSEAQWYRMLDISAAVVDSHFDDTRANLNFNHYASSVPVDTFEHASLYDVVGNVWQWTRTPIYGFEGFKPHPVYDDFSLPTFDGKHNLMKGGSWASTGNEITLHSRYAFRRHFYQHAGFRYILDGGSDVSGQENVYETDELVAQYCEFQYGETYFDVGNFARTCAEHAVMFSKQTAQKRALDLGCATGRASFELARVFDEVTGIDFSARFVQVGSQMQREGRIAYARVEEGEIKTRHTRTLAEFGLEEAAKRVQFWQGDACNLKPHFRGYDLILATNLIDRLYEPLQLLDEVHERLNPQGLLILTSPYTWLEEYTARDHWLGGSFDEEGRPLYSEAALSELLSLRFERIALLDIPFVIRETARKYQHTVAQMSVWRKR